MGRSSTFCRGAGCICAPLEYRLGGHRDTDRRPNLFDEFILLAAQDPWRYWRDGVVPHLGRQFLGIYVRCARGHIFRDMGPRAIRSAGFSDLAWIPWALWAMEVWLKRPSLRTAALFGAALSLVIFSGYPQGLHGTMIYAVVTVLIVPFHAGIRNEWVKSWRKRAVLLLVVGVIAVGLSFVQLFPLLELIGLSHRSTGIGIVFAGLTPLTTYVRGLLVTDFAASAATGSLLVCILASSTVFLPDARSDQRSYAGCVRFAYPRLGTGNTDLSVPL